MARQKTPPAVRTTTRTTESAPRPSATLAVAVAKYTGRRGQVVRADRDPAAGPINEAHRQASEGLKMFVAAAIECGRLLSEKFATTPHGEWGPWVAKHCDFAGRTERQYRWLYDHREKWQRVATSEEPTSLRELIAIVRESDRGHRQEVRQEIAEQGAKTPIEQEFTFYHCGLLKAPIPDASVDFVVIDPPWDRKSLPTYREAAQVAARILRPGGLALWYVGGHYLPEITQMLGKHLQYRWPLYVTYRGGQCSYFAGCLKNRGRLLLLYSQGTYRHPKGAKWAFDWYAAGRQHSDAKKHHRWGQDLDALTYWLSRLTQPGQTVADLTLGGGTTAAACKWLGRRQFVGVDRDEQAIHVCKARLPDIQAGSYEDEVPAGPAQND